MSEFRDRIDCRDSGASYTITGGNASSFAAIAEAHAAAHRHHLELEKAAPEERTDGARALTARQAGALRVIWRDYDFRHQPVSAAFVAEALGVSHERARNLFRRLHELGWLRSPGTPAIPTEMPAN